MIKTKKTIPAVINENARQKIIEMMQRYSSSSSTSSTISKFSKLSNPPNAEELS
jgi:hypothetical protein